MGERGPAVELHVAVEPDLLPASPGAGGVHHVAFRTPNDTEYQGWAERLRELQASSGPVDRHYFRSLYFREPNGILFEITTDGPGFATDEPLDRRAAGSAAVPGAAAGCDRGQPQSSGDRLIRPPLIRS